MKIDRNKPVFPCAHGPSLHNLENELMCFSDSDVYWMSISVIEPIEDMLSKIEKKLDIFYVAVPRMIMATGRSISEFIQREQTLLLSSTLGSLVIDQTFRDMYIDTYKWDYFWYLGESPSPNSRLLACDLGVSFTALFGALAILIALGFKKIYLFGADGTMKNGQRYFSKVQEFKSKPAIRQTDHFSSDDYYNAGLYNNTTAFNQTSCMMIDKWGLTDWNPNFDIINVSPDSMYSVFEKISIDDLRSKLEK